VVENIRAKLLLPGHRKVLEGKRPLPRVKHLVPFGLNDPQVKFMKQAYC